MENLKTLNELYEDIRGTELNLNEFYIHLKAEAVKWVKYEKLKEREQVINFIMHFFNLTEADLK